jgi:NitT/TauT family transport system ATP-binding protein
LVTAPDVLRFDGVSRVYESAGRGRVVAVEDLSFSVPADEDGEFLALLGPSGCGKSTILHMIAGLQVPDSGEISVKGAHVEGPNSHSVTVPQAYTCFPWRTALGNVLFGLEIDGVPSGEARKRAQKYLELVHLGGRENAYPRELSGGMQQRVAIARALALNRPIVLMDEPFGALDAQTRAGMQRLIVELWQQERSLIVFVTHDISEALLLADRIIVLDGPPAKIVFDSKIAFARPRSLALQSDPNFLRLYQSILGMLKNPESASRKASEAPA